MATQILRDCSLWLDGYDLSGDHNTLGLAYGVDLQDATAFKQTAKRRKAGLKAVSAAHEGFWSGGTNLVDEVLFGRIGGAGVPMTIAPLTGADGEVAYSFLAAMARYAPGAAVGEMLKFAVEAEGDGELVRGTIMHNATRSATGTGTARQLGAVATGQKLYAALHVLAISGAGATLTALVRSDDAVGMPSPTTRITFSAKTAVGGEWATPVAGPITDDYWQVTWTISGTTPSILFAVTIGIR